MDRFHRGAISSWNSFTLQFGLRANRQRWRFVDLKRPKLYAMYELQAKENNVISLSHYWPIWKRLLQERAGETYAARMRHECSGDAAAMQLRCSGDTPTIGDAARSHRNDDYTSE